MSFNWTKLSDDFIQQGDLPDLTKDEFYKAYDGPSPDDEMWKEICHEEKLSQKLIDRLKDYINWTEVCRTQYLTPDFVINHLEQVNLPALKENPMLDLSNSKWQNLVPYMEPGKRKPRFVAQKAEDKQSLTVTVMTPRAFAEAIAVPLVRQGVKTRNGVQAFFAAIKAKKEYVKNLPRNSYNAVKQKINDIADGTYQPEDKFVTVQMKKPTLVTPKEFAADFKANMSEAGRNIKEIVNAFSILKNTGLKILRDIAPVRFNQAPAMAPSR